MRSVYRPRRLRTWSPSLSTAAIQARRYGARAMERHPWNTAFEWADHTGPTRRLTANEVDQFDAQGYVVVPDLVDAVALAEATAELDRFEAQVDAFLQTQEDGRLDVAETGA